jgi:hypothetical protein
VELLAITPSNLPEYGNAAKAYDEIVRPSKLDLKRVAAHYAVASLFSENPADVNLFSYTAQSKAYRQFRIGKHRLCIGKVLLRSAITLETEELSFAMLHMGDHQLYGGVREFVDQEAYEAMFGEISSCFERVNFYEIIGLMDKHFQTHSYSIWHLFRDEQRRVMNNLATKTTEDVQLGFENIYNNHYPMMVAMSELRMALPDQLRVPIELHFNQRLYKLLQTGHPNLDKLDSIMRETERFKLNIDRVKLAFLMTARVDELARKLAAVPMNQEIMNSLVHLIQLATRARLELELWNIQNICYSIYRKYYPRCYAVRETGNDPEVISWCDTFDQLFSLVGMDNIVEELPKTVSSVQSDA